MTHRLLVTFAVAAALPLAGASAAARRAKRPAAKAPKAKPKLPDFQKALWIWDTKGALTDGVFGCYFRKTFTLAAKPASAVVLATADNGYDLYVNGSLVGGDAGYDGVYWRSFETYDVAALLEPGKNVLAVRGQNMGGPAGLLVAARIGLADGTALELVTDGSWRQWLLPQTGWQSAEHDDSGWRPVAVLARVGQGVWGKMTYPGPTSPRHDRGRSTARFVEAGPDYPWPAGALFVRGRVPPTSTRMAQAIWRIAGSRAYLENDILAPAALGRQLYALVPARPDGRVTLLHDAGAGLLGSPSASFDGQTIYFAMAPAGEKFFHIHRIAPDGTGLRALTSGPFHDCDPEPLPDGRLVFSSTRIGNREEYHGNPASALFTMHADGSAIRPLTFHIVGDHEPRVTAAGAIAFIRRDIFFERAKVETQIHQVRPDGTGGVVLLGADRQAIGYDPFHAAERNSAWLRRYGFGSPAPLADGSVASISNYGLVVSGKGTVVPRKVHPAMAPFDVAALPDGRLLCTLAGQGGVGVLHPDTGDVVMCYGVPTHDAHSVAYLGPRPKPPAVQASVEPDEARRLDKTGFLVCQSVFYTKQQNADLSRIRAIRVYEGKPFALRAARHQYCHIGVEAVELGTVPLAPDGSFYARVPADRALALQAVDAEGRPVISEASWIYVRPGERRTCVGCHSARPGAPSVRDPIAARVRPASLLGQGDPHAYRGNNAGNGGVLNLQYDRFREAASINLHRQAALAPGQAASPLPPGRPAEVRRLAALLAGRDAAAKVSAARRLAILRDRAAVPALLQALRDASADVRLAAALALSTCGNRAAAPGLLAALGDRSPHVAQAAHVALENLTGHGPPFNGFSPDARAQGAAAWRAWLQAHPWPAVEAGLIQRLADEDPVAVQEAIEALGHTGADAARAALRDYLAKNHTTAGLNRVLAALRALGHLRDPAAIGVLRDVLLANIGKRGGRSPDLHELGWLQRPIHLAAGAAEALGWIGSPEAEKALIDVYPKLAEFWYYTFRSGDHSWLMGCHSSPIHYRIVEALDAIGSRRAGPIVPAILRAVPIDTDRGLLLTSDAYETLTARVVQRAGLMPAVVEACLATLGDQAAQPDPALKKGIVPSPPASSCRPLRPEPRSAQLLAVCCLAPRFAPRIRDALDRFRATKPSRDRSWTCFLLARALGRLRDPSVLPSLIACLEEDPNETQLGLVDPPNTFIYASMTPFYRAAAAYALGEIGDRRAIPTLLAAVANLDNAMDVRRSAAQALALVADAAALPRLEKLAADYPEVATRRALLRACKLAAARR